MNIKALGPLTPEEDDEWLVSQPIPVPYFDGQALTFTIVVWEDVDEAEVERVVDAFLSLTAKDRQAAKPEIFRYYSKIAGRSTTKFECSEDNVWDFIQPDEIFVYPPDGDEPAYVCITAECDWDAEHGLQLSYMNGNELTKVSDQGDSHS